MTALLRPASTTGPFSMPNLVNVFKFNSSNLYEIVICYGRVLEVVAVFGSAQMAASRIINLQHHRIAQCHSVKITILGKFFENCVLDQYVR